MRILSGLKAKCVSIANAVNDQFKPAVLFCKKQLKKIRAFFNRFFYKIKPVCIRIFRFLRRLIIKAGGFLIDITRRSMPGIFLCNVLIALFLAVIFIFNINGKILPETLAGIIFALTLLVAFYIIIRLLFIESEAVVLKSVLPFLERIKNLKPLLFVFNLIFALYITLIVLLKSYNGKIPEKRIVIISAGLLMAIVYIAFKLFFLEFDIKLSRFDEQKFLSWKTFYVFIFISALVYTVLIINFTANFPGGITTDNVDQWVQVQSKTFDNLHSPIHTMIIWLVTRIKNSYSFVLQIQILVFSLMAAYLAATLVSWGIKTGWIAVFLFILLSPRTTYNILLYAWKDSAFTITLMCLTAFMINIAMSDGLWLKKIRNIAAFVIVFALASFMRHNGIMFTIPLLLFLFLFIKKAKLFLVLTVCLSVLACYGIREGLYKKANVEYLEGHTYFESVGLPMTILGGVFVNNPDALDEETKEFLFKIVSEQQWNRSFRTGNFNSIKWLVQERFREAVNEIHPADLLNMALRAVKNAPEESLAEFIALTGYVWDPFYWDGEVVIWNNGSQLGFMYTQAEVDAMKPTTEKYIDINNKISEIMELISPDRLLTSFGLYMLLLLIFGFYSLNRNLGYKSLFLFVPSLAYNIGTMLIISGPEWRFFHFNTVITFPLILCLLAAEKKQ